MTDTVKLIIEMPEDKAERLLAQMRLDRNFSECKITQLPKGLGDLKDGDRLKEVFRRNTGYDYHDLIDIAPTIVEAKSEESAKNYQNLKKLVEMAAKSFGIENTVAEIYNIFNEYLIDAEQEVELYNLADPDDTISCPADSWFSGKGVTPLYDYAQDRVSFDKAVAALA